MSEVICRGWAMVEPLKEVAEGKEALVEGAHNIGVGEGGSACYLAAMCK